MCFLTRMKDASSHHLQSVGLFRVHSGVGSLRNSSLASNSPLAWMNVGNESLCGPVLSDRSEGV